MAEDDTIKRIKLRRSQIKGELTRFHTFLDKFQALPGSKTQLESRLDTIRDILAEFKQIQSEFEEAQMEKGDLDEEAADTERDSFEIKYYDDIARAKDILQSLTGQVSSPSLPFAAGLAFATGPSATAKLPPLKIPEFSGSYSEWQRFYDTFTALVHNNSNLLDIERFYYLQGSLKGEAAQVIASLQISEANYVKAFKLLQDRYDNKKAIINAHLKEIFELPVIPKESHVNLRRFFDTFLKNCRALESLQEPVTSWSTMLIYMLIAKLDFYSKREWENYSKEIAQPNLDDFTKFLNQRCQMLEALESKTTGNRRVSDGPKSFYATQGVSFACPLCHEKHFIYSCPKFKNLNISARYEQIRKLRLCSNCLRKGHINNECRSTGCKICNGRHSTFLHQSSPIENKDRNTNHPSNEITSANKSQQQNSTLVAQGVLEKDRQHEPQTVLSHYIKKPTENLVLLSTAVVRVFSSEGKPLLCRVLLDSGSQSNFITRDLAEKLNLQVTKINLPVSGINQIKTNISQRTTINIASLHHSFKTEITCLVIDKITDMSPQSTFDILDFNIPNVPLADPDFNVAATVDILLGCSLFFELLTVGQIKLGKNLPALQNTLLGWIVAGNIPISRQQSKCFFLNSNDNFDLNSQLEKFWVMEEIPRDFKNDWTNEERECEEHFVHNFTRNEEGRFIVKLPLKGNFQDLGESEERALNRLYAMERKLSKNKELNEQYKAFLNEYKDLDHMFEISRVKKSDTPIYYLPHHSVLKPDSATTKVRVVFDASAKSSTNLSLNDVLMDGSVIQNDLFSILIRFRQHEVVFIGDLAKMYRQILIHPDHHNLQRIVWRESPDERVKYFTLQTLTYGTRPASFLATRCLNQIVVENIKGFPIECKVISKDMYMDDVLTGASDSLTLNKIRENLTNLLSLYGFEIRKFQSNDKNILEGISQTTDSQYTISDDSSTKTLGVSWILSLDVFIYKGEELCHNTNQVTKRAILSYVAKVFDPLGLLGPILIRFKFLIQLLWQLQVAWDDPVPSEIYNQWLDFQAQLLHIYQIEIPRKVIINHPNQIVVHGFSDASEKSYACAVYLQSTDIQGNIQCNLLCAKSRVAPLKSITLPRLELCGALLLSRLVTKCLSALDIKIDDIFLWTDSTIVLSWIAGEPRMWKAFVSNRITEIQALFDKTRWNYISSSMNPADIISRGANLVDLIHSDLWWHGPPFLGQNLDSWPKDVNIINYSRNLNKIPEYRTSVASFLSSKASASEAFDIFERFSNYGKLVRVTAYCLRFIENLSVSYNNRKFGQLTALEIDRSTERLVKIVQYDCFPNDLKSMNKDKSVSLKSNLKSLSPYIDENGLLRVGGRLQNTELSYTQKHPIILPGRHPFTRLLIIREHERSLHSGLHTTLSHIRQNFWPVNGKNSVKSCIRKCIKCYRVKPNNMSVQMGQLPGARVTPSIPFISSAVDFAGPFELKDGKTRNRKIVKAYISIFVCLSSKAVHLELVSDLSSDGFLNTLKRFVSRRGICSDLYSDNATNFIGADNQLKAINKLVNHEPFQNYLNNSKINWHFIPARSPHFGGLWEAAVKSCKHHLKRVLNQTPLTYEEFYSILTQVEAVLNSRPIIPMSPDPNDLEALTPGHFLIGRPLTAVPQQDLANSKVNYIKRYQLIQQMFQHFWTRWVKEYLHILQQRTKWQFDKNPRLKLGSMVIMKEDGVPPLFWSLGRIVDLHPGMDNIVRVASVRSKNGIFKRAITKLCLLPMDE